MNAPDQPRLSKLLSERGICSRRQADEWIANGWVRVDGKLVTVLGTRVAPDASIAIDPAATLGSTDAITLLIHKPARDATRPSESTRWGEDPSRIEFRRGHLQGLVDAAPLDGAASGLAILTQDAHIARRVADAEREYLVRLAGELSPEGFETLRRGPARVSWQNEKTLRMVLRAEQPAQIGRMCEAAGASIESIRRVRIGSVPLAKLPLGEWRYLMRSERL